MSELSVNSTVPTKSVETLESIARTRFSDWYQSGKCTAGCPRASAMDIVPNRLIRMVQLRRAEEALRSEAIWQCASCETCTTRCPKSVDCAAIMDACATRRTGAGMTNEKQRRSFSSRRPSSTTSRRNGRLDEIELIAQFEDFGFRGHTEPAVSVQGREPRVEAPGAREVAPQRREGAR